MADYFRISRASSWRLNNGDVHFEIGAHLCVVTHEWIADTYIGKPGESVKPEECLKVAVEHDGEITELLVSKIKVGDIEPDGRVVLKSLKAR